MHSQFYRADKLLEEAMEAIIADPKKSAEEKDEAKKVCAQADGYSQEELGQMLKKYGVKAPDSGNELSDPYPFNLMFPTPIGPAGDQQVEGRDADCRGC